MKIQLTVVFFPQCIGLLIILGGTEFRKEQRLKNRAYFGEFCVGLLCPHSQGRHYEWEELERRWATAWWRLLLLLQKFILKCTTGSKKALHFSFGWQQMWWQGIRVLKQEWDYGSSLPCLGARNSLLFARFLHSTCGQWALPQGLPF